MIKNELYIKHLYEISNLASKLQDTLDKLPSDDEETLEERKMHNALYRAAYELQDAKEDIEHFSRKTKEGILRETYCERFALVDRNDNLIHEFHCGNHIEVYLKEELEKDIEGGWYAGRVEYSDSKGGYYFYGANKPALQDGMKARIRV